MKGFTKGPTPDQLKIVELLARDFTVPEMSVLLNKKEGDIAKYIARAKDKLGVKTSHGLVSEAHRKGYIDIQSSKKKVR